MTENRLIVRSPPAWDGRARNLAEAQAVATAMAASGYFEDAKSGAQALVKILAGAELGVGPFAAMRGVDIIDGKPVPGAHLLAAQIMRHHAYVVVECTRSACEVEFFRRFGKDEKPASVGRIRLTIQDAKDSGWTVNRKGNEQPAWLKTPDDMLFARVIAKAYRRYYPDLTAGVPELEGEEPTPTVIETTVTSVTTNGAPEEPTTPAVPNPEFERLGRIDALVTECGISPEQWMKRLMKDRVTSVGQLSPQQLDKIEAELNNIIAKRKPAAAPAA